MNDRDALIAAAGIIRTNGHWKWEYWPYAGLTDYQDGQPCCVTGALIVATSRRASLCGLVKEELPGYRALERYLAATGKWTPIGTSNVVLWNDAVETSQDIVVETLTRAAAAICSIGVRQ